MPSDEDGIMGVFKDECKKELSKINEMLFKYGENRLYPGEDILKEGKKLLSKIIDIKDTLDFFKEIYDLEDKLLHYADNIDPIKGFFYKKENGRIEFTSKGEQRLIFDNALKKLQNFEENKEYIVNDDIKEIIDEIRQITRMQKPYSKIPTVPLLIEKYDNKILELLEEESIPVKGFIQVCRKEVFETLDSCDFKDKFQNRIIEDFKNLFNRVDKSDNFVVLSSMSDLAEKVKIKWVKEIIREKETQKRIEAKKREERERALIKSGAKPLVETIKPQPVPPVVINTKTLSMRELVKGQKTIKNVHDIDEIVENLRKKLREELEKDTIISLI